MPDVDYDKCSNIIKNLLRNEPKNIEYLEIMAYLQEKTDHAFDAIKTYRQILRIEPTNSDAKKENKFIEFKFEKKKALIWKLKKIKVQVLIMKMKKKKKKTMKKVRNNYL